MFFLLLACSPPDEGGPIPKGERPPLTDPTPDTDDTGTEPTDDTGTTEPDADLPEWTFLVYIVGDNNLEEYVIHDLNELEAGGSSERVNVLVQADRAEGYDDSDGDWTGTRRYRITGDDDLEVVSSAVVEDMGELDMGIPETLSDFLLWAAETAPAQHYFLSLWNHGDGWYATSAPPPPPSIGTDDETGNSLSIAEGDLAAGLQPFVAQHGKIDVLAFDACYMGYWEVAHSLIPHADAMVASQAWVGGEGLNYDRALQMLVADPTSTPRELAAKMAEDAVVYGGEMTFSSVDLGALAEVTEAIDAVARFGLASEEGSAALIAGRDATRGADPFWKDSYLDMGDLGAVLATNSDPTLADAGARVDAGVESAVIAAFGDEDYGWTSGLSVFFDPAYAPAMAAYSNGDGATWAEVTEWDEYLITLLQVENSAR